MCYLACSLNWKSSMNISQNIMVFNWRYVKTSGITYVFVVMMWLSLPLSPKEASVRLLYLLFSHQLFLSFLLLPFKCFTIFQSSRSWCSDFWLWHVRLFHPSLSKAIFFYFSVDVFFCGTCIFLIVACNVLGTQNIFFCKVKKENAIAPLCFGSWSNGVYCVV